jgi:hypothetical protein
MGSIIVGRGRSTRDVVDERKEFVEDAMKIRFITATLGLLFSLSVFTANTAYAQGQPSGTVAQNTTDDQSASAQVTTGPSGAAVQTSFWEPMGGLDLDSHSTGYAWAGPQYQRRFNDNLGLIARAGVNYLFYEYESGLGTTKVSGPGFNTLVGMRFGNRNWLQVGAGPSWKRRNQQFELAGNRVDQGSEWRTGMNVGADAYVNPTSRTNVMAQGQFSTEDNFMWSRLAAKQQLSNFNYTSHIANFAGAEVTRMGNEDFNSTTIGGLFEFLHVPSSMSIQLRAGWKRSEYDFGDDKTGPYFGIGYYQRLK